MSRTITVEGDVNAIDTRTLLTTQGSVTAPSLVVPAGMTKIKKIIAVAASDNAADDGAACMFIRLGGNAVLNGEQVLFINGSGGQTIQTGSDAAPSLGIPFILNDADIDVRASDTITIAAEMAGIDVGDTTVGVTLVYGK